VEWGWHTTAMEAGEATPIEVGWMRGGNWRATQAALVMLYARRALRPGGTAGTVERASASLTGAHPLECALYGVLYGSVGPRELMNKPRSRSALSALRRQLSAAGLVRPRWRRVVIPGALVCAQVALLTELGTVPVWTVVPLVLALSGLIGLLASRRTIAGSRMLRVLRIRHAALSKTRRDVHHLTPVEAGMAVALFGDAALRAILPGSVLAAGLLDEGRWWTADPQRAETPVVWDSNSDLY